jgi:hypothetical protein
MVRKRNSPPPQIARPLAGGYGTYAGIVIIDASYHFESPFRASRLSHSYRHACAWTVMAINWNFILQRPGFLMVQHNPKVIEVSIEADVYH